MILSSSFLRIIWQSTLLCFVLSWNTSFSTMCVAVLLSLYSLIGHSKENQFLSINFYFRLALMSHLPLLCTLILHWIEKSHSTFLLFYDIRFPTRNTQYPVIDLLSKEHLLSSHLRNLLLECIYDLNREAIFLELSLNTSKFSLPPASE